MDKQITNSLVWGFTLSILALLLLMVHGQGSTSTPTPTGSPAATPYDCGLERHEDLNVSQAMSSLVTTDGAHLLDLIVYQVCYDTGLAYTFFIMVGGHHFQLDPGHWIVDGVYSHISAYVDTYTRTQACKYILVRVYKSELTVTVDLSINVLLPIGFSCSPPIRTTPYYKSTTTTPPPTTNSTANMTVTNSHFMGTTESGTAFPASKINVVALSIIVAVTAAENSV